ncbi:MAG: LuxR C-terminal-related transcriptional regulator [Negativicutes bacterium]|nr:LuxR C-terminal-related transcriptional regulator [Negativicutes bacterium]
MTDGLYKPEKLPKLSVRELEVLTWAARGKTFPEISMLLSIKEDTVKFHIEQAGRKLNTSNKTHTVAVAVALGLIAMFEIPP